jgi:ATP-dependent Lon protease
MPAPQAPLPPIVATVVYPPAPAARAAGLARLSAAEREYVRSELRKRDRVELVKLLDADAKRQRGALAAPLRVQVLRSALPEAVRLQIFEELRGGCDKYVQWVRRALRLPLGRVASTPRGTPTTAGAVAAARAILDGAATGHAAAKREVLKLVCQARRGGTGAGAYALGLEGPPGTGKTHFVERALAPALGRPMVRIPLGGATDISYLLGNVYTYEGSKEGRLAAALVEAGCCNPVVYFDEVDKVSASERGQEIVAVLIHLVDPTANGALRDRYFHGIDLDFSRCTFVFSYNDASRVSPVLLDRIKRVAMPPPSDTERAAIVRAHLEPRARARLNSALALSDGAVAAVLARAGGGGMRGAEQDVDHVLAAAQLCAACDEANDGALAGAPGTAVLDADGRVGAAFAARVLRERGDDHAAAAAPPPPAGMYT